MLVRGIFRLLKFKQINRVNMKRINTIEYVLIFDMGYNAKAVGVFGGEFVLVKYLGEKKLLFVGNMFQDATEFLTRVN